MRRANPMSYILLLVAAWFLAFTLVLVTVATQSAARTTAADEPGAPWAGEKGGIAQFGPPAPPSDEVVNNVIYARLREARLADIKPHDLEFYTFNYAYDEATLVLRNRGRVYKAKLPKLDPKHRYDHAQSRVSFPNVEPERGFTLTVIGKNGKTIAVFSSQPLTTPDEMGPGYLHICDGPHLSMNGTGNGIWPVGHEGDVRDWYEKESCGDYGCPRSYFTYDSVLKY